MFHNSSVRFISKFSAYRMSLHDHSIFLSLSLNLSEFSVLVDVLNAERGCANPVDDYILSLYQFNISSANNQPVDKGKCWRTQKLHFQSIFFDVSYLLLMT